MFAGDSASRSQAPLAPGAAEATFFLHPGRYFFRQETAVGIRPAFGVMSVD